MVATTHLLFSPKRGDVKLAQLAVILAELDWISRRRRGRFLRPDCQNQSTNRRRLPTVFCGDMNFEPFCPLFDFVVGGSVRYAGVDVHSLVGDIEDKVKKKASLRNPRIFPEPTLLPPSIGITEKCRKATPE